MRDSGGSASPTAIQLVAEQRDPVVFMLWGEKAKRKTAFIGDPHLVLESSHPVHRAFSAGREKHFSQADEHLKKAGRALAPRMT